MKKHFFHFYSRAAAYLRDSKVVKAEWNTKQITQYLFVFPRRILYSPKAKLCKVSEKPNLFGLFRAAAYLRDSKVVKAEWNTYFIA